MKPATLLRLYPRAWRERYGDEFLAMCDGRLLSAFEVADVLRLAVAEWLWHTGIDVFVLALTVSSLAFVTGSALRARWEAPTELLVVDLFAALVYFAAIGTLLWRWRRAGRQKQAVYSPFGAPVFGAGLALALLVGVNHVWCLGAPHLYGGQLDVVLGVVGGPSFTIGLALCTARQRARNPMQGAPRSAARVPLHPLGLD